MEQYIPKSALVAEIERRIDELYDLLPDASKVENGSITMSEACNTGKYTVLESFRRFINTIEVTEVNLEKSVDVDSMVTEYLKQYEEAGQTPFAMNIIGSAYRKGLEDMFRLKAQKGDNE